MPKRYILFMATDELTEQDANEFTEILEGRHGKLKVILLKGNARAVIVRTAEPVASEIRKSSWKISLEGKEISAVLTSGAIGKLKRRASESGMAKVGQISKR